MMDIISQIKTADMILKTFRGDLRHMTPYPFKPEKALSGGQRAEVSAPLHAGGTGRPLGISGAVLPGAGRLPGHQRAQRCRPAARPPDRAGPLEALYGRLRPDGVLAFQKRHGDGGRHGGRGGAFSLSDNLAELFSDRLPPFHSAKPGSVTVKNLLNMSSGIRFNEAGTVTERDWLRACLQSDCSFEPGTEFSYNSLNSYLLSALVCKNRAWGWWNT